MNPGELNKAGRRLFLMTSTALFWGVLLFVPAMACASVDRDRRSGTLASLRLTPLGSWRILTGKANAMACLFGLVFLAGSPVTGLCFLIGGMSLSELLAVLALTLAASYQCILFAEICGLYFRKSSSALLAGFLLSLLYLVLIPRFISLLALAASYGWLTFIPRAGIDQFSQIWTDYSAYIFPGQALGKVLQPGAIPQLSLGPVSIPFWLVTIVSVALTSTLTLPAGVYLLHRQAWLRPSRRTVRRVMDRRTRLFTIKNLLDEKHNPYQDWETRSHPVIRSKYIIWGLIAIGSLFFLLIFTLSPGGGELFFYLGTAYLGFGWLWAALVPIFYCSQTVVREREMGTYDSLKLTLLRPRQIVLSKVHTSLLYVLSVLGVAAFVCLLGHANAYLYPATSPVLTMFEMNFVWLVVQVIRTIYFSLLGTLCSLYFNSSLKALAATLLVEGLLMIPYTLLTVVFSCCSLGLLGAFGMSPAFTMDWANSILASYGRTIVQQAAPVVFMILLARVFYARAVYFIRFESRRR